jgi:hypothetical protein
LHARNITAADLLYVRNDGRVGIGTTAPVAHLHVTHAGGAGLTDPATLRITNTTLQGSAQIRFGEDFPLAVEDGMIIRYNSSSDGVDNGLEFLGFGNGVPGGVHMRIERDRGGRTGIGTGSSIPSAKLHVVKNPADTDAYYILKIEDQPADPSPLVMNPLGDLGVGLDPSAKMDVGGNIKVGDDSSVCNGTTAGSIRYTGGQFRGCNGTSWIFLRAPRIVHGSVNADGTLGYGVGFTTAKLGTGRYRVQFNTPFNNTPPSIIVPPLPPFLFDFYKISNASAVGFDLTIEDAAGNATDQAFNFIAM